MKYEGEKKDGKPHGNGTMTYDDGGVYVGEWRNGNRHGRGVMTWPAEDPSRRQRYRGGWVDDSMHGFGQMTFSEPGLGTYVGGWSHGIRSGFGTAIFPDGNSRAGFWSGDDFTEPEEPSASSGSEDLPSESVEEEPPVDDFPDGVWEIEYPDRTIYEGECRSRKHHGTGVITWENGSAYRGEWQEGLIHGKGEFVWGSLVVYKGVFDRGRITAEGVVILPDGAEFDLSVAGAGGAGRVSFDGERIVVLDPPGEKSRATGKVCWPDGSEYVGGIRDGELHGSGVIRFRSGHSWDGGFKADGPDGPGMFSFKAKVPGFRWLREEHSFPFDFENPNSPIGEERLDGANETTQAPSPNVYCHPWEGVVRDRLASSMTGERSDIARKCIRTELLMVTERLPGFLDEIKFTYRGAWDFGTPHGLGKGEYHDGSVYEGEWRKGQRNGLGRMRFRDGSQYDGNWLDGHRHGKGLMRYKDGSEYDGDWAVGGDRGRRYGRGRMIYADGSHYVGEWRDDRREGRGRMTYPNGTQYDGMWSDDLPNGYGEMKYASKRKDFPSTYKGEWRDGLKEGKGQMTERWGESYEGEYIAGERCGYGTVSQSYGSHPFRRTVIRTAKWYEGEWDEGTRCGIGKGSFTDLVACWDGSWFADQPFGAGKLLLTDGTRFEGDWFDDDLTREYGTITYADGSVFEGSLRHHQPIFGKMNFADGLIYEGRWSECNSSDYLRDGFPQDSVQPHGIGRLSLPNGTKHSGRWFFGMLFDRHYEDSVPADTTENWDELCSLYKLSSYHHLPEKPSGKGYLRWIDGSRFHGLVEDASRKGFAGLGKLVLTDGTVCDGEFFLGGGFKGTASSENGLRLEGEWDELQTRENLPPDEKFLQCLLNDTPLHGTFELTKTGKGIIHYPDGTRYEGEWIWSRSIEFCVESQIIPGQCLLNMSLTETKRHGEGVMIGVDGSRLEGTWWMGEPYEQT